jgi:hypothetical protein
VKPIRTHLALVALATTISLIQLPLPAAADCRSSTIVGAWSDGPARLAPRQEARDAEIAIGNRGGQLTLLLTRDAVAIQLSNKMLKQIRHEIREDADQADEGAFGQAIRTVVAGVVQSALRQSLEYPLRDVRDVSYQDGKLRIVTVDGERLFHRIEVDDAEFLEDFHQADAREFVREFRRLKSARGDRGRTSL